MNSKLTPNQKRYRKEYLKVAKKVNKDLINNTKFKLKNSNFKVVNDIELKRKKIINYGVNLDIAKQLHEDEIDQLLKLFRKQKELKVDIDSYSNERYFLEQKIIELKQILETKINYRINAFLSERGLK